MAVIATMTDSFSNLVNMLPFKTRLLWVVLNDLKSPFQLKQFYDSVLQCVGEILDHREERNVRLTPELKSLAQK